MADEGMEKPAGWIDRIKESPRTVSALIIILIVAAAIYAFSGKQQQPGVEQGESPAPTEALPAEQGNAQASPTTDNKNGEQAGNATSPQPTAVSQEQLSDESKKLPEAAKTDKGYVEVAQRGNGLTHLARRATTRWLSENQAGYTVTNEHRIYIEDYVRRRLAQGSVSIGATRTVSFDLIAEAVTAAGKLSNTQLRNLTPYANALT